MTEWLRFVGCLNHFDPHKVRADAFNLLKNKFLTGERDGDYEHNRSAADDDAERGKHRAKFICAERFHGDSEGFVEIHHGVIRAAGASMPRWRTDS